MAIKVWNLKAWICKCGRIAVAMRATSFLAKTLAMTELNPKNVDKTKWNPVRQSQNVESQFRIPLVIARFALARRGNLRFE